jgi:CelD/BcsL family acetyltransferase involved in cellulose biosynthesis
MRAPPDRFTVEATPPVPTEPSYDRSVASTATQTPPRYAVECTTVEALRHDASAFAAWERLVHARPTEGVFYASPPWVEHVTRNGAPVRLFVARAASGEVHGVAPVMQHTERLGCEIRGRAVARIPTCVAVVLGSVPLMPPDERLLIDWIASVYRAFPRCQAVLFDALPLSDPYFARIRQPALRRHFIYHAREISHTHLVELGTNFDEYLSKLRPAPRSNLRRAVQQFHARTGGTPTLDCYRAPDDVQRFLRDAARVRQRSWQYDPTGRVVQDLAKAGDRFRDLARRGVLRSYVLRHGETPCAFVVGYQYQGVYYYSEAGYDRAFARHSPGTVLFHLLLRHLHDVDRPSLLHFGLGDDAYKRRLATRSPKVISCVLFRPGLTGALRKLGNELLFGRTRKLDVDERP